MKIKYFFLLSLLSTFNLWSLEHNAAANFNILSFNTMLLPIPVSLSHQATRTKQIINYLKTYPADVVALQEVFVNSYRKKIQTLLKQTYPYQYHLEKSKTDKLSFLSSGLVLLSKHPFTLLEAIHFENFNKLSFDRFSSKGAIFAEFKIKNKPSLQLAMTHLQAGSSDKNASLRIKQLEEIRQMQLRNRRHNTMQALVGDININGYDALAMSNAKEILPFSNSVLMGPVKYSHGHNTNCFDYYGFLTKDKNKWLDHFWLTYKNENLKTTITQAIIPILGNIKRKSCPLSDHYAIHANLKW